MLSLSSSYGVWIKLPIILLMPFSIFFFLYNNRKRLRRKNFKKKYGSMYENIFISKYYEIRGSNWLPMFYTPIFLLRRFLLGFLTY